MLREDDFRMKIRGPYLGPYNIIPSFYDEMKLIEGKHDMCAFLGKDSRQKS